MKLPKPSALLAALVLAVGLAGAGRGFLNGDAACYAAQALAGDLGQRTVHGGWTGLAWLLGLAAGEHLPVVLDAVVALCAGAAVLLAGRRGLLPALAVAGLVLPWASSAEVDLPWVTAILGSVVVEDRRLRGVLVAVAVSLSPSALLALPWVIWEGRRSWRQELPWIAGGALLAVLALSLAGGGEWWVGDRGVLHSPSPRPWRALQAWAVPILPLVLLAGLRWKRALPVLALTLPLLLAPPDIPAWLVPGAALGLALGEVEEPTWRRAVGAVLAATLALGGLGWWRTLERVQAEDAVIREILEELGPEDGLVAPWTWGARASTLATGDPYELPWIAWPTPVRDQAQRWCEARPARVLVLPPGLEVEPLVCP